MTGRRAACAALAYAACASALVFPTRRVATPRSTRNRRPSIDWDTIDAPATAGAEDEPEPAEVPSRRGIVAFAAPVAALNLANFAMGSVDTAAVGTFGTTTQLAALAPGTMGMEYSCYSLSFLTTASLNLLSTITDPEEEDRDEWDATLADALRVAVVVGLVHGTLLLTCAAPLASLLGASREYGTVAAAARYLKLRAASAVAFHLSAVCGAAHFARKDSKTPLFTILVAGIANIVGDAVLCPLAEAGRVPYVADAISAAAVATVGAQFLGLGFTLAALKRTDRFPRRKAWRWKTFKGWRKFVAYAGPLSQLLWCRIAIYAYVGRCASLLGAVAGAAQQIMSTLFWGSTTLSAEPFCVAAETFLPDHYDPEQPDVIAPRFRQTLRRVVDSSVLWGLSITALTAATTGAATLSLFTRQPEVLKQISMRPILVVSSLIAPMLTAEGVLVVLGEYGWLVRSMATAALCSAAVVTGLQRAGRGSIASYWWATCAFTVLRLCFNLVGVATHVRRARVRNVESYLEEKREAAIERKLTSAPRWLDLHRAGLDLFANHERIP